MAKLRKFTLTHNDDRGGWDLRQDKSNQLIHHFKKKENATRGGVLERMLGPQGGSVKIQKEDGDYQEERTYPGSKDPASSPG